jgi:hypothetical protein
MCENDECVFPFGEDPQVLKEVCKLQPTYSPVSIIKQVHLVQEGKLSGAPGTFQEGTSAGEQELKDQLLTQQCKINDMLTRSKDGRGVSPSSLGSIGGDSNDDPFNQIFFPEPADSEMAKVDFSIGSEPVFQVEKVCRPHYSSYLHSYTDLDSVRDDISACVSQDGNISEIVADAEMEEENSEYTSSNQSHFNFVQKDGDCSDISNCWPTISCTHSFVGLTQFMITSCLIVSVPLRCPARAPPWLHW